MEGSCASSAERSSYDDTEFFNSLKNGKNAVLSATKGVVSGGASGNTASSSGLSGAKSHGKVSNMSSIEFGDLGVMGPPALKDVSSVMKMIAMRRNIRLEESDTAGASDRSGAGGGGKSRRTLGMTFLFYCCISV